MLFQKLIPYLFLYVCKSGILYNTAFCFICLLQAVRSVRLKFFYIAMEIVLENQNKYCSSSL
jgi:hypothetical protein